jgi:hypothetical protein
VGRIRAKVGEQRFLEQLQAELRSGAYRPSPSRREDNFMPARAQWDWRLWRGLRSTVDVIMAMLKCIPADTLLACGEFERRSSCRA